MPSICLVMTSSAPDHFNAIADRYAASEVHAKSPTINRLHELLEPEQKESICEIACGPGYLALSFAGKSSRITGIDAAPNMLLQFEKLAAEKGIEVEAVQAKAEEVPFPSGSFDIVVSRLAPHHFADPEKAVCEMARMAKPGGCVAVIDLEGSEDPVLDELNHQLEIWHDPSHVRSYPPSQWRKFFETAGLAIEALEPGQTELPGGLSVKRWCEIGNTDPDAQSRIRERLASTPAVQLEGLGFRPEAGEFYIPVRTLLIIGRKGPL